MSFWTSLFHKRTRAESALLISVGDDSVAGAYAIYNQSEMPTLLYMHRLKVEKREGEPSGPAMLRSLDTLGNELLREGAPSLLRATGSGRADKVLVSVDAQWAETKMRVEHFERKEPFLFTKDMLARALKEDRITSPGKTLVNESFVSFTLNGYETRNPYEKMTQHASATVLSSFVDSDIAKSVSSALRGLFHTEKIKLITGSSLRYKAIRKAFPHEHDVLILDALCSRIFISLTHKNLLDSVAGELPTLAKQRSLPRTVFLLAEEPIASHLRKSLLSDSTRSLWLSEEPKVVPVLASHLSGLVRQTTIAPPDLPLLLMALYHKL